VPASCCPPFRHADAREKLRQEMAECAREMFEEIVALERDFHPLEEEATAAMLGSLSD